MSPRLSVFIRGFIRDSHSTSSLWEHRLAADDRAIDLDVHDLVGIDVVRVLLEDHEIGELAGGDRALELSSDEA